MFGHRAGCKLVRAVSLGGLAFLSVGLLFLTGCGGGTSTQSVQPPVLSYSTPAAVYTKGTAIAPNPPINGGGAATSFMVTPALPAGLSLSTTTGVISGTPTAVAAQATYTVTANNSGGSGHATLSITVNDVAPSGLSYSVNPATYAVGAAITANMPSWSGGTPTSFSGTVPTGLSLDPATGVISGTPAQQVGYPNVNSYQITASNSGGSTSTTANITIIPPAPTISMQPASQTVASGISTYVIVGGGELGGIVSYQWYKNGVAISGSNSNIYATPVLTPADNGAQFYVVISDNYNRSVTSSIATLTIKGVSGTFVNTGTPGVARDCDTATLLQNGTVLFAGGRNGNTTLNEAEIYDRGTGNFTVTGSLNATRCGHSATLLPNGNVLIAGGSYISGNSIPTLASAELYDPSTGKFFPTGSLQTGRTAHTATLLASGKVLIAGGDTSSTGFSYSLVTTAELYDPVAGTFSLTGSPITARAASAVLLNNGQVLFVGGFGGVGSNTGVLGTSELYDPIAGTFSTTGSLTAPRADASATLLQNGKVLVAGGVDGSGGLLASAELFDPTTGTFTTTGALNSACIPIATLLPNGQVFMGVCVLNGSSITMASIYDPSSGVFVLNAPPNPGGSIGSTSTLLPNGQLLLQGQATSAISLTQPLRAELYIP